MRRKTSIQQRRHTSIWWRRHTSIQQRKTELISRGYAETDKPCPDCGCFVWQLDRDISFTPYDDTDTVIEERQSCPCCGWESVTYDGLS